LELSALNEYLEKYTAANASLFAVSPQLPEHSRATIEKHGLNFEVLYDPNNAFARNLDLVHGFPQELIDIYQGTFSIDVARSNGMSVWELPMPSRFVINSDHTIKAQEVNASYTNRPEPEATLQIVASVL
jgi:peroxiredoxin